MFIKGGTFFGSVQGVSKTKLETLGKQNFRQIIFRNFGYRSIREYSLLPHLDAQECRVFLRHPADLPEDATCPLTITDKTDRTDSKECFKITRPLLPKSLGETSGTSY